MYAVALIKDADSVQAGDGLAMNRAGDSGVVQVGGDATTFSVAVQGRLDAAMDWETIATVTEADTSLQAILLAPQMRADVTAVSGGSVSAFVAAE